ncbi:putative repeat protein (TIGR03847 family) [Motilibacter peucedani]|uniref:Putative repeat protein (TIGR03847 family) n=1 Tax=Motilibacter peucedani TaxID=598650 RepID=A0A420XJZ6_9ACTN|nr:DUF3090 domain-containing protein [Motilibacter peucedani]RKS67940.1 putative repeat protein (TIGR03847 family) [Motilibacter peucedani]
MPRQLFEYDPPERFVAGTIGEPGARAFYLQATAFGRTTTVALEKGQVAALADRVEDLLDEVVRRTAGTAAVPAVAPADLDDDGPLELPVTEEFRVGTMALAWDADTEQLVVEAQALVEDDEAAEEPLSDDDSPEGPDLLRVRMSGAAGRAFAKRAKALVASGRPACPFCGLPLDPGGHICPRANGYRR